MARTVAYSSAYSDGGEDRDRKINNVTDCLSRNKEYTSARLRINR